MPQFYSTEAGPNANVAWHVVHTRHQHEKIVADFLAHRGFEIFLPLYSALHRWADRNKRVSLPLFPCYVFLHGGIGGRTEILKTPGVHGIVGTGGRPGVVPDEEIAAIRRAVENPLAVEPHPYLNVGDWVRITDGPLFGLEGILARKRDQLRLVLSVEMLGRSVAVEVDPSIVERVSRPTNGRIPACVGF